MSTIKTKNIKQTVISGTTQPLKIGGILEDGSDAKITIDTSGNVSLNNLSNTLNLTSGQIKFPTTQNPSADANTLDDYEEGTWTPADTFGVVGFNTVSGSYVKIGKFVTAYFDFIINTNTNVSFLTLNNPFPPKSGVDGFITYSTFNTVGQAIMVMNGNFWHGTNALTYANGSTRRFRGVLVYEAI